MRYSILFLIILIWFASCHTDREKLEKKVLQNPHFNSWAHYLGDPARTHFSTLSQIDTSNVHSLKLSWSYESGGLAEDRNTQIQTNPLIVDNVLYGVNAANSLFALNAANGNEIWTFSPETADETGLGLSRGLMYWPSSGDAPSRLLFTSGYSLYAINS